MPQSYNKLFRKLDERLTFVPKGIRKNNLEYKSVGIFGKFLLGLLVYLCGARAINISDNIEHT